MKKKTSLEAEDQSSPYTLETIEKYRRRHPRNPSAVKRPRAMIQDGRYIAVLGPSIKRGVIGFGTSIFSALHAFDDLYVLSGRGRNGARERLLA
ncbi:MAG: hypothetical protein ACR2G0_09895 [Chthoniobacterales bacterium]